MKKEEWIDKVLESGKGLKAEASPFLFEKIVSRINARTEENIVRPGLKWAFAFSVLLLVTVNLFSVIRISSAEPTVVSETVELSDDYNYSTNYNY